MPDGITISPDSRFLLEALPNFDQVAVFSIGAGGTLAQVPGSPFAAHSSGAVTNVDVTCSANFAFGGTTGWVDAFGFGGTGVLAPISGSPYTSGIGSPQIVALSRDDKLLFAADLDSYITVFNVAANGGLTQVAGSPFYAPGGQSLSGMATDVSKNFLYSADTSGRIAAFGIAANGALTPIAGSPYSTGASGLGNGGFPQSLAAYPPKSCSTPTWLVISPPNPTAVVQGAIGPVTFSATLTGAGGTPIGGATISFSIDGSGVGSAVTSADGVATFSSYDPSALSPGNHNVQASFAQLAIGSVLYGASTSSQQTLNITVPSTLTLDVPNPSLVFAGSAGPVSLSTQLKRNDSATAIVGATATFQVDSAPVGSAVTDATGSAAILYSPSALPPGPHSIKALFAGQVIGGITFLANTSSIGTLTVNKLPATVMFTSLSAAYDGTPKSATAITNPSSLNVVFTYGGNTAPPVEPGSYAAIATINDPVYSGSASSAFVIAKATPGVHDNGPGSSAYGQSVTLAVTITPPAGTTPAGQVTFSYVQNSTTWYVCADGGISTTACGVNVVATGNTYVASVSTTHLPPGTDGIMAAYSGDSNFSGASANTVSVIVSRADTAVSLAKSAAISTYGDSAALTVRVSDTTANSTGLPTGTVSLSFKLNPADSTVYSICADGSVTTTSCGSGIALAPDPADTTGKTAFATVSTANLPAGLAAASYAYAINATYSGDTNFNATGPYGLSQTVNPRPITVTAATDTKAYDGTPASTGVPTITLGNLVNGSTANFTQSFDSRNAGARTLTAAGTANDGNGGNNYAYTFVTAVGTINKRAITVAAAQSTRTYDGSATSNGPPSITLGSLAAGDATTSFSQTFDSRNAGSRTLTASGTVNDGNGGNNYGYTFNTAAGTINKASLTISAMANSKVFDGSMIALATPTLSGVQAGDTVTGLAEIYDTPAAGTGKTLSVSAYSVKDGNSGNNYTVSKPVSTSGVVLAYQEAGAVKVSAPEQFYTGAETFTATLPLAQVGTESAASAVSFYVCPAAAITVTAQCQNMTPTPAPLTMANGGLTGSATVYLTETLAGALAPGMHAVLAVFSPGPDFLLSIPSASLTIDPKLTVPVGDTFYTGATVAWTPSVTSNSATLALSATVTDPCGTLYPAGYAICGNVTRGTVTFNIWNGTSLTPIAGATNLPVGLVNTGDPTVGSAAATVQYNLGNANSVSLDIRVTVSGYYIGGDPSQDITLYVSKPILVNEMKLGGALLCNSAASVVPSGTSDKYGTCASDWAVPTAGTLSGEARHMTQFDGDVTYTNKGTNPQGYVSAHLVSMYKPDGTLDNTPHTYLIKSNSISTFSQVSAGVASFTAKASITDITNPNATVSVDGGALMQVTACASGSACPQGPATVGRAGAGSIQINSSKTGAVWFSSSWNGRQTIPQNAAGGVIQID